MLGSKWCLLARLSALALILASLAATALPRENFQPPKGKQPRGATAIIRGQGEIKAGHLQKMPRAPAKAVQSKHPHKRLLPPVHPKLTAKQLKTLPKVARKEGAGIVKKTIHLHPKQPILATSWEASGGLSGGGCASDSQIAVSTTHVVVTSRAVIAFYDKAGTLLHGPVYTGDFFKGLDVVKNGKVGGFNDARTIFDAYRKRFFLVCLGHPNAPGVRPQILCAVSKSENPLDGFYLSHWDGAAWEEGVAHKDDDIDYPCLGIDGRFLYQTNAVGDGNGYRYWHVIFFDAKAMTQGKGAAGWHYYDLKHPDGNAAWLIQPVVHHGTSPHGFLVSRYGNNQVIVWALTDGLKPTQKLETSAVTVAPYQNPVDAPQKGSGLPIKMTNLGTGIIKAVYRQGKLYMVGNDARGWGDDNNPLTSIRFLRFNVQGFPSIPTTTSSGFIDRAFGGHHVSEPAGTRMHYAWPGVEVNKDGDMAIVYARTGSTIDPQVRVSLYHASEADISPSTLLKNGEAYYTFADFKVLPWGDTAGACVDPHDDRSIWVSQQYTVSRNKLKDNNYSVWVAKVYGPTFPYLVPIVQLHDPVAVKPGAKLSLDVTVTNHGDGPAKATTGTVHVSKKAQVRASDQKIGEFSVQPLKRGAHHVIKVTGTLPASLADGTYHVGIVLNSVEPEYRRGATTQVAAKAITVKK
jgi:hypothetical protein